MLTHSDAMISLSVAALSAQIEAHRSANEYIELKINDAPVKVIDAQYPRGTKLCVYREGPWYEAADDYRFTGKRWVVLRSYFGPYFDGSLDHTVVYVRGEQA